MGAVPGAIPAVIAIKIPHFLLRGGVNTGMVAQVLVEGGRPTFLTPNNEEIRQHPRRGSYLLVHTLQDLSGHAPDGRGDEACDASAETHLWCSSYYPDNVSFVCGPHGPPRQVVALRDRRAVRATPHRVCAGCSGPTSWPERYGQLTSLPTVYYVNVTWRLKRHECGGRDNDGDRPTGLRRHENTGPRGFPRRAREQYSTASHYCSSSTGKCTGNEHRGTPSSGGCTGTS